MGSVRQAVLEFDATVRVPWRPLLADGPAGGPAPARRPVRPDASARPARQDPPAPPAPLPGAGPRVAGHLRPVPDLPAEPAARAAGPAAGARRTRRDPARPGGRPVSAQPVRRAPGRTAVPAPAPVRLTRRGRRLVVVLVLAAGLGGALLGREVLAPRQGLQLAGESSVVVEPGDTVWSIADDVAGDGQDVRAVVHAIEALNDLEGSAVVAGQVLRLP
ncbi:LysM domain-containing protein [Geodermatophilus saharensis]|uniref:LysM domain-containing protein n=1 Tax=Geodermatophilus saharensis TaxID=1137994 RepID=A0A239ENK1_9ACTN|nr:LysM peptidoglycan-binding domain-containing protein [Geodermatophilus saharensis]SNS46217.1 LysM domain-containing protein [Geodermatophilus saharensis]